MVQDGDEIELNLAKRQLYLHLDDTELAWRREAWQPPPTPFTRGYGRLYVENVNQAPLGCDFDFLRGADPVQVTRQPKF